MVRVYHLLDVQCILFPAEKAIVDCQRRPIGSLQTTKLTQYRDHRSSEETHSPRASKRLTSEIFGHISRYDRDFETRILS
jgi:hypothetical protein